MKTNVSTLLRDFPRIRRAALAGDTVIIETREGNLRLTAERSVSKSVLGCMKGQLVRSADSIDTPTTRVSDWKPGL